MNNARSLFALALLGVGAACGATRNAGSQPTAERAPTSGFALRQVSMDDWSDPEELRSALEGVAADGFDGVLFEVRRDGYCAFRSPRAPTPEVFDGWDSRWDPLPAAAQIADELKLDFYVELEVLPAWRGGTDPADASHPVRRFEHWIFERAEGDEGSGSVRIIEPSLPNARIELVNLIASAVVPGVDGIVLTGLRFYGDDDSILVSATDELPLNRRVRELYRQATSYEPGDSPERWGMWRADQLTELLRTLRDRLEDRDIRLLAEVLPDEVLARRHRQAWETWIEDDLVDGVVPNLGRADSAPLEESRLLLWRDASSRGVDVFGAIDITGQDLERVQRIAGDLDGVVVRGTFGG